MKKLAVFLVLLLFIMGAATIANDDSNNNALSPSSTPKTYSFDEYDSYDSFEIPSFPVIDYEFFKNYDFNSTPAPFIDYGQSSDYDISTKAPTIAPATEKKVNYVFVSRQGKIHRRSNCSGMKYYSTMSYSDAINKGYVKCKKCY